MAKTSKKKYSDLLQERLFKKREAGWYQSLYVKSKTTASAVITSYESLYKSLQTVVYTPQQVKNWISWRGYLDPITTFKSAEPAKAEFNQEEFNKKYPSYWDF